MYREKIVSRYKKTLELLADAVLAVDRAFIYDNSNKTILLAEKDAHIMMILERKVPSWFHRYVIRKLS